MLNKEILLLITFLTGGLIKLYDDIKDNNLISDYDENRNSKMTILKIFIIILFFMTSMLDMNFLFISVFVAFPLSMYSGGMDIEFWNTLFYVSYIALLFNLEKVMDNMSEKFLLLIITSFLIIMETKLFPEEKSKRKTNFRIIFTIVGLLSIYFIRGTKLEFIQNFMFFWIGYGVSSLLFQHFVLNQYISLNDDSAIRLKDSNNLSL
jgi:hypothetical protein